MATRDGADVDLLTISSEGESTKGRFVVWSGYPAYLGDVVTYVYKLRGYYVSGSVHEEWVSTDIDSSPPSGHTLTNRHVVEIWTIVI